MDAIKIAALALNQTNDVIPFLSAEVREKLAIAQVAIIIDGMDDSTTASVRIRRLSEAMAEIRRHFNA